MTLDIFIAVKILIGLFVMAALFSVLMLADVSQRGICYVGQTYFWLTTVSH